MANSGTNDARELEIDAIRVIMSSEGGRGFLNRLLQETGLDRSSFDNDPITHARNAGQRSVGVWLRDELIEADLDLYLRMIKEYHDE